MAYYYTSNVLVYYINILHDLARRHHTGILLLPSYTTMLL